VVIHNKIRQKPVILFHVTTVPQTLNFFRGQIAFIKERGFEIHAVSSPGVMLQEAEARESIPVYPVAMPRRISLIADLKALYQLYRLFRRYHPDIVHAHTPKGGLLGVLAARLARVPIVIYTMRGLPYITATGLKQKILISTETLACRLADRVLAVSFSLRQRAVAMKFCPGEKIRVLGCGSSNGVEAKSRFNPERINPDARRTIRNLYEIPLDALVIGYVGRIVRDKGMVELGEAWQRLRTAFPDLYLMLIGPLEPQDPIPQILLKQWQDDPRVVFTGRIKDMVPYYAAINVLVLPTYREGFPNTPLEAAAMELPVVATQVDGCVDAVVDGVTGLLVPPGDRAALAQAIAQLLLNPEQRQQMGNMGRQRVLRDFRPEVIWQGLYETYVDLLHS